MAFAENSGLFEFEQHQNLIIFKFGETSVFISFQDEYFDQS